MSELLYAKVVEQITNIIMSISVTSISNTPDKLINKGPDFFRRSSNQHGMFEHRRKSAVELLEASKGEYVKTVSVLKQKQELKHPENLQIGARPKSIVLGSEPRSKSDLGLSPVSPTDFSDCIKAGENVIKPTKCGSESNKSLVKESNPQVLTPHGKLSTNMTSTPKPVGETKLQELDRRKPVAKSKDFLSPSAFQSLSTSVTVLVEKRCNGSTEKSNDPKDLVVRRKKKPLHRSQSDLSGRWSRNSSDFSDLSSRVSRTSTEVERFFNEMGLESSILERMRKFSSVQVNDEELFESISSIDSAERSSCSDVSTGEKDTQSKDKELKERNAVQTSIVEKNARIIKWLYNVKKARVIPSNEKQDTHSKK